MNPGMRHRKKTRDPAAYLFAVIQRMLRNDPSERYPTAASVASNLTIIDQEGPVFVRLDRHVFRVGNLLVGIRMGDLAQVEADILVNAAHHSVDMPVGVAAALRPASGAAMEKAARKHAPVAS
jgi:hypothetical protein